MPQKHKAFPSTPATSSPATSSPATSSPATSSPATSSPATSSPVLIGVDVAKAELVIASNEASTAPAQTLANNRTAIKRWLGSLPVGCQIAMESTSSYHVLLADLAWAAGHTVYVLNPKQIKHYRTATSTRAKTDLCDATLIVRFLQAESQHLFPYQPLSPQLRRLHALVHRRATVVKTLSQLKLSLQNDAADLHLQREWNTFVRHYQTFLKAIDQKIEILLGHQELKEKAARLRSIVGLGAPTTALLLAALERGQFKDADALVAYFGLDPRPRESGQMRGKRKLSKQGDGEARRLLFNAARSASQSKVWKAFYERNRLRWTPTECFCILARKLVRVAWVIHRKQIAFCREMGQRQIKVQAV